MPPPSMFHDATRERFQRRIDRLTPDSERQWGKMSVDQMVCHLSDQLRLALGELSAGASVPAIAVLVQGGLSCLYAFSGSFTVVGATVTYTAVPLS